MAYQHFLVTLDLGPQSLYIAKQCCKIAKIFKAELDCLHVIEPPMTYTTDFNKRQKIIDKNCQLAKKSLHALCQRLTGQSSPEEIVLVGSPQDQILALAQEQNYDLILIGSHGVGGYTHLLGSTAHHVLSHAHCDVLIIQVSHLEEMLKQQPSQDFLWDNLTTQTTIQQSNKTDGPPHSGSKHGFGENVSRGPRLVNRPGQYPYKGGHRQKDQTDENKKNNPDDSDK
tara:strand:+ start:18213 stop:18893 length:681 start_codon:yes stop_codon:yes gene_type:complete